MRFVWVISPPGAFFWDFVAGAGLCGLIGGIVTFAPLLALLGLGLLFVGLRSA